MRRTLLIAVLASVPVFTFGQPVRPTAPIPDQDLDILRVRLGLVRVQFVRDKIHSTRWPIVSRRELTQSLVALRLMEKELREMQPYLAAARKDLLAHHKALSDNAQLSRERLDATQMAQEVQTILIDFSAFLLDAISIVDFLESVTKSPAVQNWAAGRQQTMAAVWRRLQTFDTRLEAGLAAIQSAFYVKSASAAYLRGGVEPESSGVGTLLLDLKSGLSSLKNAIAGLVEADLQTKELAVGVRNTTPAEIAKIRRAAIGNFAQVIARIGLVAARAQQAELNKRARELESTLKAEERQVKIAFLDYRRANERTDSLEELRQEVKQAGDDLERDYAALFGAPTMNLPPVRRYESWGEALRTQNARLLSFKEVLDQRLGEVVVEAPTPGTVLISSQVVRAGEEFEVTFTAPVQYSATAWIGIVPSSVPHGSESVNDQHDIAYQYVSKRPSGTMRFRAPDQPGRYDIRFFDDDGGGVEVAFVSFEVRAG